MPAPIKNKPLPKKQPSSQRKTLPLRRIPCDPKSMVYDASYQSFVDLKKQDCSEVDPPPISNFGLQLNHLDPTTMYMRGPGSSTGATTTRTELGIVLNDYFDYQTADASNIAQYVHHYWWDTRQNLFNNAPLAVGGTDQTFCRVRKVEVWVLPQARGFEDDGTGPIDIRTNAQQMFTVNVQTPAYALEAIAPTSLAVATNTQVTNVLPQFDTKWKKVFTCDLQKTFQSGVVRPAFAGPPLAAGFASNQCLFSMSLLEPTTGRPYQTGSTANPDPSIRVRVQLTIDQPISTFNEAKIAVFKNEDFAEPYLPQNGFAWVPPAASYCQLDLKSVNNFFR